MRRTWWGRAFSACMIVWLVLWSSASTLLQVCPLHGGHMQAGAHSAHSGHDSHAAMAKSLTSHAGTPTKAPAEGSHGRCTVGQCCVPAPAGIAPSPVAIATPGLAVAYNPGLPSYGYVPAATQHVLPFQNGPPTGL